MRNILFYLSIILIFASCKAQKDATASGQDGKSETFVDLYYNQDVVEEKIPLASLQSAQYRLSKKIVYTSSGWTKGAYTDEAGNIVLPDKTKLYQIIYDEDLPGTYDLEGNKGSTSRQSFFVDFSTTVKGPSLKMSSTGGLYFPPKTFNWAGRTWTANDINDVNLKVRFVPDNKEEIITLKLDGSLLGGEGSNTQEAPSGDGSEQIIDSPPSQDRVVKDPEPSQAPQSPPAGTKPKMTPRR